MARVVEDVAIGQLFEPYASRPDEPWDLLFHCPRCRSLLGKHLVGQEEGAYFETELSSQYVRLPDGSYGTSARRARSKPVRLDLRIEAWWKYAGTVPRLRPDYGQPTEPPLDLDALLAEAERYLKEQVS